jgi:hypothetical protein
VPSRRICGGNGVKGAIITDALHAAENGGEIHYQCLEIQDLECVLGTITEASPDGVIAPHHVLGHLTEGLRPSCPVFDVDRLFEFPSDSGKIFADEPGHGYGLLDTGGNLWIGVAGSVTVWLCAATLGDHAHLKM